MKKDMAMVCDREGNEIFLGETGGECQRWCIANGIDGSNEEYIAYGDYNEDERSFETYDYEEINNDAWRDWM